MQPLETKTSTVMATVMPARHGVIKSFCHVSSPAGR